ncbi:MAG: metallophosphoesterase family protein [Caldilinea sp.]
MTEQSSTTIGIITDTHYWVRSRPIYTTEGGLQLQPWSEQILTTLLAELQAAQVDLIIHLGDQVCGGGGYAMPDNEFEEALELMHRCLHSVGAPVYVLPGNHDVRPGSGDLRKFYSLWQSEAGIGKTIDLPQARLILLNTMGHTPKQIADAPDGDPVYGYVAEAELARLDEAIATADGRPVLVFTHQLLAPWTGSQPWRDFYGVHNASQVWAIIKRRGGVSAVLQGHAHRLDIQECTIGRPCVVGVMPATIEYPVAWMQLRLNSTQGHLQLCRLPLPEISALAEQSGGGQNWRQGEADWWDYRFSL